MRVFCQEEGDTGVFATQQGIILEGHGTTHTVGQDPFDERFAVSMSLALRVGESQLLAQGGRASASGRAGHTMTTFGVVCAISSS